MVTETFELIDRFEKAVDANGYRTRDRHTEEEYRAAKAALEAALSAAEPVAWRYRHDNVVGWSYSDTKHPRSDLEQEALYAAPPAPSVAVKALEWVDDVAEEMGLRYILCDPSEDLEGNGWFVFEEATNTEIKADGSPEGAKAAAQADYEARIRSALSAQVKDVAGWQAVKRDVAVSIVDAVHGYTCDFSSDPAYHASQYDVAEQIIDDALAPAAPAKQEG